MTQHIDLDALQALEATPREIEFARLAADHYGRPESDVPALIAFERHRKEQVKIPGMPGLSGAVPNFIAGFNTGADALIARLRKAEAKQAIGAQLANVAFNFAQKCGHTLTSGDCSLFDSLRTQWDAAPSDSGREG